VEALKLGVDLFPGDAGLHFEDHPVALVAARVNFDWGIYVGIVPGEAHREHADYGEV
jgi:hypothetical protein